MKRFITLSFLLSVLLLSCTTNKTTPISQVDAGTAGAVSIGGGDAGTVDTCDASECDASECDGGAGGTDGTATAGVGGK